MCILSGREGGGDVISGCSEGEGLMGVVSGGGGAHGRGK